MDLVAKLTRDTWSDVLLDIGLFSAFTGIMVIITIVSNNFWLFFLLESGFLFLWFLFKYIWSLILRWGVLYDLKRTGLEEMRGRASETVLYDK